MQYLRDCYWAITGRVWSPTDEPCEWSPTQEDPCDISRSTSLCEGPFSTVDDECESNSIDSERRCTARMSDNDDDSDCSTQNSTTTPKSCSGNISNRSYDLPSQGEPSPRCEPPPRYGMLYFVKAAGKQFNRHVDPLSYVGDDVSITDQCTCLQLFYRLVTINMTAIRRVSGLFPVVLSAISVLGLIVQFVTSRLLDIADTCNRRDASVKTIVLSAQCAILALAAYVCVLVYNLIIRMWWDVTTRILNKSLMTGFGFDSLFELIIFLILSIILYCI